jgi:hypothetical protein
MATRVSESGRCGSGRLLVVDKKLVEGYAKLVYELGYPVYPILDFMHFHQRLRMEFLPQRNESKIVDAIDGTTIKVLIEKCGRTYSSPAWTNHDRSK